MGPSGTPTRIAALFGCGALLLQSAWILAVPPFRAIDEFDHAYRANSVAEGYWRTWEAPDDGRGDLIPVRRSIIEDARKICESYEYPGPDNCRPVEHLGDGMATVASAASRYHPLYYWFVGLPSLFFDGAAGLYAMRWAAATICALFIAVTAGIISKWSRSPWPIAGYGLALTPVLVYSTSVPAPNGIEMLAGAGLWVCLLTLSPDNPATARRIVAATILTAVLVTVRPLGTLWLGLILTTAAIVGRPALEILRRHSRLTATWGAITFLSIVSAATWYISARTHEIDVIVTSGVNRWQEANGEISVWLMQSIAAFPLRNEGPPLVVYALVFIPFVSLVGAALIVGDARVRLALSIGGLLAVLTPYVFTVLTVTRHGTIWQGRYTLPFAVGLAILPGFVLAKSRRSFRLGRPLALMLGLGVVLAHVVSVVHVQVEEARLSPLAGDERWVQVPISLTALLATLGAALWYVTVFAKNEERADSPRNSSQETNA